MIKKINQPSGPVRHQADPVFIPADDSLVLGQLLLGVVQEHRGPSCPEVGLEVLVLDLSLVGEEGRCPDLAVRVRIGAAHHGALVLEDLDPGILLSEDLHLGAPGLDDFGQFRN